MFWFLLFCRQNQKAKVMLDLTEVKERDRKLLLIKEKSLSTVFWHLHLLYSRAQKKGKRTNNKMPEKFIIETPSSTQ